jgi:hypothetical protein
MNNDEKIRQLNDQAGAAARELADNGKIIFDNWFQNLPKDTQISLKGFGYGFGLACIIFFIIWIF